jgi:hypothetical protein
VDLMNIMNLVTLSSFDASLLEQNLIASSTSKFYFKKCLSLSGIYTRNNPEPI